MDLDDKVWHYVLAGGSLALGAVLKDLVETLIDRCFRRNAPPKK